MKATPIHKSVVAIGGFNPTILAPDFLNKYCSFKSSEKPIGRSTPVLAEIKFGNVKFLMELNKFQILEEPSDNFNKEFPLDIMLSYLKILEYTPLVLLGLNFNYSLTEFDYSALREALFTPSQTEKIFDINPISLALAATNPSGKELKLSEIAFVYQYYKDIKTNKKVNFKEDSINLNLNYEVNGLNKERDNIHQFTKKYSSFVANNETMIKTIGGIRK